MSKVFEKIDQDNQKEIDKLKANIAKAEAMIEKISPGLRYDTDIEEYSNINIKINSYKDFIERNKEQIEFIINNPYTVEDCNSRREEIQKEYNYKFKKIYSDIINQANRLCNSLDEYRQVTESFLSDRNTLNVRAYKVGASANVYEGEGIRNDYYSEYKTLATELEKLIRLNRVQ